MDRVRAVFEVDDEIDSAFPDAELSSSTSPERYRSWRRGADEAGLKVTEHLLPRIVRNVVREWPIFMERHPGHRDLSVQDFRRRVKELGPWRKPFHLAHGLTTIQGPREQTAADAMLFRRDLVVGTVADLLGDRLDQTTFLDLGCNDGFFSLDLAARGAKHVDGIDLRLHNIEQARFLAEHYGIENVDFAVGDIEELGSDEQWDVVLNLGVLYHVTYPVQFLRQTYDLCREFAVIDTVCHPEPVSAFILLGDKDTDSPGVGSEVLEFHPTYRGAIDTILHVGFSDVYEVSGIADPTHDKYALGDRRCFFALK